MSQIFAITAIILEVGVGTWPYLVLFPESESAWKAVMRRLWKYFGTSG